MDMQFKRRINFKNLILTLSILGCVSTTTPVYAAADPTTATVTVGTVSITANGTSTSLITLDTLDGTATGETVVFSATGSGTIGSTTDVGDGTYTATYTSSTTAGTVTITATLGGVAVTDNATITQTAGAYDVATSLITVSPSSITADGASTSVVTLQTKDTNGNNLTSGGETVVFSATGSGTIGSTTDVGDGTYTAIYTSSTTAGTVTISATIGGVAVTDNENITETAPAPAPAPEPVYIPKTPQEVLVLSSSATTVEWGMQSKLTLTGGSGTGKVTYSSSGSTFCAIDKDGNLTPVSAGTCTVTANKDGDGTYGSAQSNSVVITATNSPVSATPTGSNSDSSLTVGKPVGGVATVKFTVADTYAGEKVSVILATKSSAGKTLYKRLGSATVSSTGEVSFKTKVKLPMGGVLQLKSAGEVIFSKSIQ